MTPICGSCAVTRLLRDAFQTMRLTRSCNSVILPHQVASLAYRGQLARCLIAVSIGPPSSRMHGESIALVSLVREQATHFHGDNKCLNNPCCFERCLMFGVLILWGLSLSLLFLFIFSLLLIMFRNGWKPNPPELTMLRLLLDLICFAGLESLEPSLVNPFL